MLIAWLIGEINCLHFFQYDGVTTFLLQTYLSYGTNTVESGSLQFSL